LNRSCIPLDLKCEAWFLRSFVSFRDRVAWCPFSAAVSCGFRRPNPHIYVLSCSFTLLSARPIQASDSLAASLTSAPSSILCTSGTMLFAAESALTTCPWILPTRNCGSKMPTMLRSRHAVSLGCAPTPTQYRAREMSSLMSFHGRPCVSPGRGACGFGSYVPRTSRGRELRAVLPHC
jgi:hypothetical protein